MPQLCSSAIGLSSESRGWAQAANYTWTNDEAGNLVLSSAVGGSTRYYIRARGRYRIELRESFAPHQSSRLKLFVSDAGVLERHLISLLGEEIREDLDLPYLDLAFAESDLADGFALDDYVNGHRVLRLNDVGPVAAAPDRQLSLVTLVPLSHFLSWTVADLKRSFLSLTGAPVLRGRFYAPAPPPRWLAAPE
ncbi:Imm61 family immunity protein [Mycobacterium paragordonae]|uniref:Imm61 family immunity protein n=1 Tax=Mycobacterium paragordonae TaxID=1389713 RepID=A0AAJ1SC55_9MYCO|nr:Imm61 family immunity protein [Mycobacterium paragordonae]MDP7739747.1 Imm61 family immunity protein [Mycobacterium paragordonae]MDP7739752.1 Imm61 family immunity protein [Mycobacterium paragordonae]